MLTQGPTPVLKCELNITSFVTLAHPLHSSICAKDIMVTILYCTVTPSDGGIERLGRGSFMLGMGWGSRSWISHFFYFFFCFCAVVNCSFMDGTDSLLCLFHFSSFAFFVFCSFFSIIMITHKVKINLQDIQQSSHYNILYNWVKLKC